jgi:hypothetical protein
MNNPCIYTVTLHQNTETSHMFRSSWDHHQGVSTSNDFVYNIKELIYTLFILHLLCIVYKNREVNCRLLGEEHVYIKQYGTFDTLNLD